MTGVPARMPNDEEIAQINARHLINTRSTPTDLLFVFGTRVKVTQSAE